MDSHPDTDSYYAALVDDFNGDRWPDIAFETYDGVGVVVLLAIGNGTFKAGKILSLPAEPLGLLVAGDFNGDGHRDLLAVVASDYLYVLLGHGNGIFQTRRAFQSNDNYQQKVIAASDLNGDGRSDLLVYYLYGNSVQLLLAENGGGLREHVRLKAGPRTTLNAIATADFNDDGHTDIGIVNTNARNIGVFLGDGRGNFSEQITSFTGGAFDPVYLAVGDFNSDRLLDVVFAYSSKYSVGLMFGHGNGSFGTTMKFYTPDDADNPTYYQVAVIDFNVDGHQDIIFHRDNPGGLDILLGNGHGQFQRQTIFPVALAESDTFLLVSDLNSDGCQDIVSLVSAPSAFDILLSTCGCRTVHP